MVYPPQMSVLTALNGQLITEKSEKPNADQIRKLINIFNSRNSIHGVNNFLRESVTIYERIVWLLVLAITIIGMIYVSLLLSKQYREGDLDTVIDSTTNPMYEINFPTITICNYNRLNWKRLEAAKERFMPLEKDPVKLELFTRFIAAFDRFSFGKFHLFENVSGQPLGLLDDVNFTTVFYFMTWRCEELFIECSWRNVKINCCDAFQPQKSELGPCYSFNGVQNKLTRNRQRTDPFYPLHNPKYGPGSGLNVKVMIHPDKHVPRSKPKKGIKLMVHEPAVWQKDAFFAPWNTITFFEIDPVIYFYDSDTRRIPSKLRRCVFEDERNSDDFKSLPGYEYMQENCFSQCHQEHLVRFCNCTLDLLYPPGDYRTCRPSDFQCIYEHRDKLQRTKTGDVEKYVFNENEGMTCECFRNCRSLNYITEAYPSYLPTATLNNSSFVEVDVHYRYCLIMAYRTSLVFGWLDLVVSFGGIAGLFLGCSLISAVEILYFVGVDLPRFLYKYVKNNWRKLIPKRRANAIQHRNDVQWLYNGKRNVLHRTRYQ